MVFYGVLVLVFGWAIFFPLIAVGVSLRRLRSTAPA
jgi:hypothetical protein